MVDITTYADKPLVTVFSDGNFENKASEYSKQHTEGTDTNSYLVIDCNKESKEPSQNIKIYVAQNNFSQYAKILDIDKIYTTISEKNKELENKITSLKSELSFANSQILTLTNRINAISRRVDELAYGHDSYPDNAYGYYRYIR